MWIGAIEGYGRPGSIVGAAAALGLFLVEPVGRVLFRRRVVPWSRVLSTRAFALVFLGVHLVLVAYGTRIAGFQETAVPRSRCGSVARRRASCSAACSGCPKRVASGAPPAPWGAPRSRRPPAPRSE
jgi:hypothetical protein